MNEQEPDDPIPGEAVRRILQAMDEAQAPMPSAGLRARLLAKVDLEAAKEIFSRHNWMLFVPNDSLREVKPVFLQIRRIVAEVGVAAPEIESAARK